MTTLELIPNCADRYHRLINCGRIEMSLRLNAASFARRRFGRAHFSGSFKFTRDLDTEVAQYLPARLSRVVVEKMLWPVVHKPGWLRIKDQTSPRAGPHAARTAALGSTRDRLPAPARGMHDPEGRATSVLPFTLS